MRQRLERHLLAQLVALGEHSISGLLTTAGRQALDWSADYRMYARCRIRPSQLFDQVRTSLLAQHPGDEPLVVAIDDTRLRKACRRQSLGCVARGQLKQLRQWFDQHQAHKRALWCVVDGGYTNATVLKDLPENTHLIGRIRCDAKLHFLPVTGPARGRRRVYGETAPTPEQLRQDESVPWETVSVWIGAKQYDLRVKTLGPLRWRPAGGGHDLKLVVIAPLPYHTTPRGKRMYRKPAYLISTDAQAATQAIVQHYIRRWDIEVNFRDEKTLLGVGEAQVRDRRAVENVTAMQVAAYALLLAAAQRASPRDNLCSLPRPKWQRRPPVRATTQRLIQQLRYELWGNSLHFSGFVSSSASTRSPRNVLPFPDSALLYASRFS